MTCMKKKTHIYFSPKLFPQSPSMILSVHIEVLIHLMVPRVWGISIDVLSIKKGDHRLFAFEKQEVRFRPLPKRTPNCTLLLFISNFWALGYFALFQSLHYYYLVADLDMQSKGHAICATLVSHGNAFSTMPRRKNPITASQGIHGLNLVNKNLKTFFFLSSLYDHPLLMSLPRKKKTQDISKQLFWSRFKQLNLSMWMALEPWIIIRRGFGHKKINK